ncbi:MAG: rRNA adenine N-6-methyltransferase family protein [Candidatus Dojkabacteria bacterium]|nr:MAG: rRNA adenine N-6-methyltransferase family protein [Candidatus Dojkabacteria bacterium]
MVPFRMKKVFGQHFLRQVPQELLFPLDYLEKIQSLQRPTAIYLGEIGPGSGVVTKAILEQILPFSQLSFHYDLIDIDSDAIAATKEVVAGAALPKRISPNFVYKDVLKHDFSAISNYEFAYIFGSLPYNVSKKIVNACEQNLLKFSPRTHFLPSRFIIQKEVADDFIASAPAATFLGNRLALHAEYRRITRKIPPGAFYPPPRVESAVLEIGWNNSLPVKVKASLAHITTIMRKGFSAKRKVLRSVFGKSLAHAPDQVSYLLHLRAHELSIAQWMLLADTLPSE